MLTKVTVYSQWANVDPLVLNVINRPDEDLFEVRNIDGLGPVTADVNTTPLGSIDGESFIGSNVGKRNIVMTLGLDPDWNDWTMSKLRRLLDKYFMPKFTIRLVFETMEFSPVEIFGHIESNEPNMFSKDPEQQISIICPKLYFRSVDPTVITGLSTDAPVDIDYQGNIETGINVLANRPAGNVDPDPAYMGVNIRDPDAHALNVTFGDVSDPLNVRNFILNTIPGDKYVGVTFGDPPGPFISLLNNTDIDRRWPVIGPGTLSFEVFAESGVQEWALTYYDLFGSL